MAPSGENAFKPDDWDEGANAFYCPFNGWKDFDAETYCAYRFQLHVDKIQNANLYQWPNNAQGIMGVEGKFYLPVLGFVAFDTVRKTKQSTSAKVIPEDRVKILVNDLVEHNLNKYNWAKSAGKNDDQIKAQGNDDFEWTKVNGFETGVWLLEDKYSGSGSANGRSWSAGQKKI